MRCCCSSDCRASIETATIGPAFTAGIESARIAAPSVLAMWPTSERLRMTTTEPYPPPDEGTIPTPPPDEGTLPTPDPAPDDSD